MPLVPVVLKGLREMRPKGSRTIKPGPASVSFLSPITIPEEMEIPEATQMLWERMNREFAEPITFPTMVETLPVESEEIERAA